MWLLTQKAPRFRSVGCGSLHLLLGSDRSDTSASPKRCFSLFLVRTVPSSSSPNLRVRERLVKGLQLLPPPPPLHRRSSQPSDVPRPETQHRSLLLTRGHPSDQGSSRNAVRQQVWGRTTEICSLQYWDFWRLLYLGYKGGK